MTTGLLDSYAEALRARGVASTSGRQVDRAGILLKDFLCCRARGGTLAGRPEWADSAVERAAEDAVAGRRTDRDDVHWGSLTHPGSIVWPIVLELGSALGAPGTLKLSAAITGYAATVTTALALGPEHAAVFHSTATAGTVGATAAAAVLLELDPPGWSAALGHAFSVLGGSRGALIEGSGTRCFHSAHAVRTGIAAALAAADGLEATRDDLARRSGALATLDPDRLFAPEPDPLTATSLRVFPTSGWNQVAYEAGLRAGRVAVGRVETIVVETDAAASEPLCRAVAEAVALGLDTAPEPLVGLVSVEPGTDGVSVRVEATGRSSTARLERPLDHPTRPASVEDLARYKWNCAPAEAEAHLDLLFDLLTSPLAKEIV